MLRRCDWAAQVRTNRLAVALVLIVHLTLVSRIAVEMSPNANEPAHLASGLYHWQTGHFDAYRVNPPLIRLWACVPLACSSGVPRFAPRLVDDGARLEWQMDDHLLASFPYRQFHLYLKIARLTLLPLVVAGGVYCWRWATSAYGTAAGWAAWLLWIFSPNLLAWSATICPDAGATCLGVAACYHFRCWMQTLRPLHALLATITAGLAILSKSTWILLAPILSLIWLGECLFRPSNRCPPFRHAAWMPLGVILMVNAGYGFSASNQRLGDIRFVSQLLGHAPGSAGSNRFSGTILHTLPIPLPVDLLLGLDAQRCEFEQRKWSYLGGRWKWGSWPHYYGCAALCKVPAGFLVLLAMRIIQDVIRFRSRNWFGGGRTNLIGRDDLLLSVLAIGMGIAISSQSGFGHHFRYALPCLPFAFIYASECFRRGAAWGRVRRLLAIAALIEGVGGSLADWPYSHSYFNLMTRCVFEQPPLLDSNLEWGEDLHLAARWLERHPAARPAFHAVVTDDLAQAMPIGWQPASNLLKPGWYLVSWQRIADPRDAFAGLRLRRPLARLGKSLCVYRITRAGDATLWPGHSEAPGRRAAAPPAPGRQPRLPVVRPHSRRRPKRRRGRSNSYDHRH